MPRKNADILNDEIQEIIGAPPHWLIRWGTMVICAVLSGFFIGSFWIKIPEKLTGSAVVDITEHGIRRCRIKLKSEGIGKLKPCQTIFIKLYNYPYMEFGELKTILPYSFDIQNNMEEKEYILTIPLSNPLITTKEIPINFQLPMYGHAEIITSDHSLIEQFLNPIRSVFIR